MGAMLDVPMALWTAITDYTGGTYISQVRAANVAQALLHWAQTFRRLNSSFVWAKTKSKLLAAVRDLPEKPLRIKETRNAWIWSPLSLRPRVVVPLLKTAFRCLRS